MVSERIRDHTNNLIDTIMHINNNNVVDQKVHIVVNVLHRLYHHLLLLLEVDLPQQGTLQNHQEEYVLQDHVLLYPLLQDVALIHAVRLIINEKRACFTIIQQKMLAVYNANSK